MRTIYIDSDFGCHVAGDSGMIVATTDFFDDRCDAFVEGYRFIPEGESWTREDGVVFQGEMIAPWKPYGVLTAHQQEYERSGALLNEVLGGVTDVQQE